MSQTTGNKASASVLEKKGKGALSKRDNSADPKGGAKKAPLGKKESQSALPQLPGGGRQASNDNVIQNPSMETDRTKTPMNMTSKNVQFKEANLTDKKGKKPNDKKENQQHLKEDKGAETLKA